MFLATLASCLLGMAGCSSGKTPRLEPQVFRGRASLPLTGDLGPYGRAFRDGFVRALAEARDTTFRWSWEWRDNGGAPDSLQAWVDSLATGNARPDLALGGLGGTASGVVLDSVSFPLLWLGDGTPHPEPGVWPLWPDQDQLVRVLGTWVAAQDTPAVALVLADGAWTGALLDHEASFPGLVSIPHDPGTRRWDREMGEILARRPRTLICWNRPVDAGSFVDRPLMAQLLSRSTLLLPEDVEAPPGARVWRVRPLWQPASPVDPFQLATADDWGHRVGAGVASAAHQKRRNPAMSWHVALRSAACDTERVDLAEGGWVPRLRIERDSL